MAPDQEAQTAGRDRAGGLRRTAITGVGVVAPGDDPRGILGTDHRGTDRDAADHGVRSRGLSVTDRRGGRLRPDRRRPHRARAAAPGPLYPVRHGGCARGGRGLGLVLELTEADREASVSGRSCSSRRIPIGSRSAWARRSAERSCSRTGSSPSRTGARNGSSTPTTRPRSCTRASFPPPRERDRLQVRGRGPVGGRLHGLHIGTRLDRVRAPDDPGPGGRRRSRRRLGVADLDLDGLLRSDQGDLAPQR